MPKVRASLYLEKDVWERAKAVTAQVDFMSVSSLVNRYLEDFVPFMEAALEQAKTGDRKSMVAFIDAFVSGNVGTLGSELAVVRRELLAEAEKEETS